ncbi:MAG: NUDIX domain-containing protein [Wolinella sp.]
MIENIRFGECLDSAYVRPKRVYYTEQGIEKSWDIIEAHDSVSVLLFHRRRDVFLVVKQFRPAVFLKNGEGYTYELCAGILDKNKSLEETASEEVYEECGYRVAPEDLLHINTFYTSVGFAGSRQALYYAEVDEDSHIDNGGGIDNENIEVIEIPLKYAREFMLDDSKPKTPGLLFAFMWFFERHVK